MEKLHCVICGEESGRINYVCGECMTKANIPKSTIEAVRETNLALEILACEILDTSAAAYNNLREATRNLNKNKTK